MQGALFWSFDAKMLGHTFTNVHLIICGGVFIASVVKSYWLF